jgi:SAM-dependent methyltransferase
MTTIAARPKSSGRRVAETLGYPPALLDAVPPEAVEGFRGVGFHLPLARLRSGERVLEVGTESGTDAFAAAALVGPRGEVVGVDAAPANLDRAEQLVLGESLSFRHAHPDRLPFGDDTFDAVLSNGGIDPEADHRRVFAEIARVLRPGGRLVVSARENVFLRALAASGLRIRGRKHGAHSVSLLAVKPAAV